MWESPGSLLYGNHHVTIPEGPDHRVVAIVFTYLPLKRLAVCHDLPCCLHSSINIRRRWGRLNTMLLTVVTTVLKLVSEIRHLRNTLCGLPRSAAPAVAQIISAAPPQSSQALVILYYYISLLWSLLYSSYFGGS